jgi:hypothetical protein
LISFVPAANGTHLKNQHDNCKPIERMPNGDEALDFLSGKVLYWFFHDGRQSPPIATRCINRLPI